MEKRKSLMNWRRWALVTVALGAVGSIIGSFVWVVIISPMFGVGARSSFLLKLIVKIFAGYADFLHARVGAGADWYFGAIPLYSGFFFMAHLVLFLVMGQYYVRGWARGEEGGKVLGRYFKVIAKMSLFFRLFRVKCGNETC